MATEVECVCLCVGLDLHSSVVISTTTVGITINEPQGMSETSTRKNQMMYDHRHISQYHDEMTDTHFQDQRYKVAENSRHLHV